MLKYKSNKLLNKLKQYKAFSIVELLIVIVVIGILVAIGTVVYSGVINRANVATIQSDLDSNTRKLQLYFTQYGSYPTTLDANKCPSAPTVDTNYCLKLTTNNTISSYSGASSTFTLNIANGSLCYRTTESTTPTNACTAGTSTYATVSSHTGTATSYTGNGTNGTSGTVYDVYSFTTVGSGSITLASAGLVDLLVIGGGGGGGWRGGGGAGGYLEASSVYLPLGSSTVVVGAGGAFSTASYDAGVNGISSRVGPYYAVGGGGGGGYGGSTGREAYPGGSGGGGAAVTAIFTGGLGVPGQGNNGGLGGGNAGGGGGGAGAVGGGAYAGGPTAAQVGGVGLASSITGVSVFRAGGGGSGGLGGNGGGGSAYGYGTTTGTVNTGGGGGGAQSGTAGAGGSGIVIIRIPRP